MEEQELSSEMCRICLNPADIPISESLYKECFSLVLPTRDEIFPNCICSDCLEMCESWKLFKEQAQDSLKRIETALRQVEVHNNAKSEVIITESEETGDQEIIVTYIRQIDDFQDEEPIDEEIIEEKETASPKTKWRLKCDQCDQGFRKQESLDAHIRGHNGQLPFVCKFCGKEFNGRLSLRNHMFTHSSVSYECEICNRKFNYPQLLTEHIKRKHQVQEKKFICDTCGKSFSKAQSLTIHQATHTDERQFACEICGIRFKTQSYLNVHKVRHEGVRKFICSEVDCGKSFFTSSELSFHIRNVHGTHKPFQCSDCDKSYVKKSQLEAHSRTHTGVRPYTCDFEECSMAFSTSSHLKTHRLIHTGEKPYSCEICNQSFRKTSTLKVHQKTHYKTPTKALKLK